MSGDLILYKMKRYIFLIFLVIFSFSGLVVSQFDDVEVTSYQKDTASKKPKEKKGGAKFSVTAQRDSSTAISDPCDQHTRDPCRCATTEGCQYDDLTSKCIAEAPNFLEKLSCRRKGAVYVYGEKVFCRNGEAEGDCVSGETVFAMNLNGKKLRDSSGVTFMAEPIINIQQQKQLLKVTSACKTVKGIRLADEGRNLYGTLIEGSPGASDSCASYPVPLMQDGEYELTIKTIAQINKCFTIKLGGTVAAEDIDLGKLSGGQDCAAVDIVFLFLVEDGGDVLYVKGHQNSIPINKGFSVKFCFGCESVPSAVFRASAYSLIRFGSGTKRFENLEFTWATNSDGSEAFSYDFLEKVNPGGGGDMGSGFGGGDGNLPTVQVQAGGGACSAVPRSQPAKCKMAGCEYSIVTEQCSSAAAVCTGAELGKVNCFRGNSVYATGGALCKSGADKGKCQIQEVKYATNINGQPHEDFRGVQYMGTDEAPDPSTDYEFVDLSSAPDSKCLDKKTGRLKIEKVQKGDAKLYGTVVRGKGESSDCLSYPVQDVRDGSYELSIKTLEPFETAPGKRAFDIKLNDELVVTNVDIAAYVGTCTALDIILQFSVSGDTLHLPGFSSAPIPVADGTVTVSFCYGQGIYKNTKYVVGGLYLALLKDSSSSPYIGGDPDLGLGLETSPELNMEVGGGLSGNSNGGDQDDADRECAPHHGKPKTCKEAGFEYRIYAQKCTKRKPDCEQLFKGDLKNFCRRPNTFYSNGGALCKNNVNGGDCSTTTAIHGVNLGSEKEYEDPTNGVLYKPEGQFATDPEGIKQNGALNGKCSVRGANIPEEEGTDLYESFVVGTKKGKGESNCISYDVPVCQDGSYALTVKMTDNLKAFNQRCFDIRIDDIPIYVGTDIARLSGGKVCQPIEIVFPLTLQDYGGGKDTKVLVIPEHNEMYFVEKKFQLKLCSCQWINPNPVFQASAFSLIRYGKGTVTCDICELYNGDEGSCSGGGCDFEANTQQCSYKKPAPEDPCGQHENNANACRKEGCEFSLVTGQCTADSGKNCDPAVFRSTLGCQRKDAFYSDGGVLCKSMKDSPKCNDGSTLWAVNLNGEEFQSPRQLTYAPEDPTFAIDPKKLRVGVASNRFCSSKKPSLEMPELLGTSVQGDPMKKGKDACLTYPIPLCQDGNYELSVMMVDGFYSAPNQRCFDIKINSIPVAYAIDLIRMGEKPCKKNELIIPFKVDKMRLTPLGHSASKGVVVDRKIYLSFCYGGCGYADPVFQVSAFSLVRFGGAAEQCDKCSIYDKNQVACEQGGCEYNAATTKCAFAEAAAGCLVYSDDPCLCEQRGCRYDDSNQKCIMESPTFENKLECRRPNAFYAFSNKVFCKNMDPAGNCKKGETIYGVNLNGPDYMDSDGIKYKKEGPGMSNDPKDIRKQGTVNNDQCKMSGVAPKDQKLYRSFVFGHPPKARGGTCLAYQVPLLQDGQYELRIRMVDGNFFEEGKRCFEIKINDVPVAVDIDLIKLGGSENCGALDIIILFLVEDNTGILRIKGQGLSTTVSGGFHLQLCFGSCKNPRQDKVFQVSAFSVFRFGDDTEVPNVMRVLTFVVEGDEECDSYSDDSCKCAVNHCRYDMFSSKCVSQNPAWKDKLPCRRPSYHYTFGSNLICKMPSEQGDCSTSKVIYGVNLGGPTYVDSNGMKFLEEKKGLAVDPLGARDAGSSKGKCPVANTKGNDGIELYGKYIFGLSVKKKAGECVSYDVKLVQDGEYELIIKTVEDLWTKEKARNFGIKINDVAVAVDVDLIKLGGGTKCTAIDIVVLFLVSDSVNSLRLKGVTTPIPITKGFQLRFCYASIKVPDAGFQVSAFAIGRFGSDTIEIESNSRPPSSPLPSPVSPQYGAVSLQPPPPRHIDPRCAVHQRNSIGCKQSGCEYDLFAYQCTSGIQECLDPNIFTEYQNCRRSDAFYANGGVLCRNRINMEPNCLKGSAVYAVNVNGRNYYWAARRINFMAENSGHYKDPGGVRKSSDDIEKYCSHRDEFFLSLVGTFRVSPPSDKPCGPLTYPIPLSGDGNYELSLWIVDNYYKEPKKRSFDIVINGMTVLFGLDLVQIGGSGCARTEIIFLFSVRNQCSELLLLGFKFPLPIAAGCSIDLTFQCGSLGYEDKNYHISSISLVKFSAEQPSPSSVGGQQSAPFSMFADPRCLSYRNGPTECKRNGCEYDLILNECATGLTMCNNPSIFTEYGDCRRLNGLYAHAGVLCRNVADMELNCLRGTVNYAVNVAGRDYYWAARRINFVAENSGHYRDPGRVRKNSGSMADYCPDRDEFFVYLVGTFAFSPPVNAPPGGPLTYPIPLTGDGNYELSIWMAETWHREPKKRSFDILINGVMVLFGLDLVQVGGSSCARNEIIFLFRVQNQCMELFASGFTFPALLRGCNFDLTFQYGSLGYEEKHYHVSSISLIKLN